MNEQIKNVYKLGFYLPIKSEVYTTCDTYKWYRISAKRPILANLADWINIALLSPCDINDVKAVNDILFKMWKEDRK